MPAYIVKVRCACPNHAKPDPLQQSGVVLVRRSVEGGGKGAAAGGAGAQVYRGRLAGLGGGEVAIKVLRPRVLASVALDLYLMRTAALALQRLPSVSALPPPPPTPRPPSKLPLLPPCAHQL